MQALLNNFSVSFIEEDNLIIANYMDSSVIVTCIKLT